MSWIGLRDKWGGAFSTVGLGQVATALQDPDRVLPCGTLLLEFAAIPGTTDQVLFDYRSPDPLGLNFEIRLDLHGSLIISHREVGTRRSYRIDAEFVTRSGGITLRFTWDQAQEIGALSMEIAETGTVFFEPISQPEPLILRDAVRMFACSKYMRLANGVKYAAIADHVMPHGPLPSLAGQTLIPTEAGRKQVAELRAGDVVMDVTGRPAQVRWSGHIDLPARGRFVPRQICAPFHGARADLMCSHDQLLRLEGSEVEYLFATDFVAAKVGDLTHGVVSVPVGQIPVVSYAQFVLDRPCVIDVAGAMIQGLDIKAIQTGAIPKQFSILANIPQPLIPVQSPTRLDVLKPFETVAWSQMQAA